MVSEMTSAQKAAALKAYQDSLRNQREVRPKKLSEG